MTVHHEATLILSVFIPDFSHGNHFHVHKIRKNNDYRLSFDVSKETHPTPKQYRWIYVNWRQLWIF